MNPKVRKTAADFAFMTVLGIFLTLVCAILGIVLVKHLNISDKRLQGSCAMYSRLTVIDINPQLTVGRVPVVTARGDSHSPSLLLHSLRGWWVGHITSLLA